MSIFAIADLHLSGDPPCKPMDRFSPSWCNHWHKIRSAWRSSVSSEDTVLIAGDTSWAMKWPDAVKDLEAISDLPGHKVIVRGNHDFWWGHCWQNAKRQCLMRSLFCTTIIISLKAGLFAAAVAGSQRMIRCSDLTMKQFTGRKSHESVLLLLQLVRNGHGRILLMLHYPPVYQLDNSNGFHGADP